MLLCRTIETRRVFLFCCESPEISIVPVIEEASNEDAIVDDIVWRKSKIPMHITLVVAIIRLETPTSSCTLLPQCTLPTCHHRNLSPQPHTVLDRASDLSMDLTLSSTLVGVRKERSK